MDDYSVEGWGGQTRWGRDETKREREREGREAERQREREWHDLACTQQQHRALTHFRSAPGQGDDMDQTPKRSSNRQPMRTGMDADRDQQSASVLICIGGKRA